MWTIREGRDVEKMENSKVVENMCNSSNMTTITESEDTRRQTINQSTTMTQFLAFQQILAF